LSWVCTRLSNPKSGVDLSFINDLFNKIASNNQHAHNILLQSVKVPLPLLPAGCFAAAGIYTCNKINRIKFASISHG
jgi:hypothetical protein